jgi:hypothetical protein
LRASSPSHEWLGYFRGSAEWGANAAGATGRGARPVKYGGDNGKPWRGALFHRARPVKYGGDNGKP